MARRKGLIARWAVCVRVSGGREVGFRACGTSVVDQPDPGAEWWTTSDVAACLGVKVGTVASYRKREQMPAPDLTVRRTHVWRPARIVAWHRARPRPGRRWAAGTGAGERTGLGATCLGGGPEFFQVVAGLGFVRYRSRRVAEVPSNHRQ